MMLCRWPSPSYSSLFICFSVSRLGGLGEVSLSCWSPGYTLHKMCLRILHPDCVDGVLSFAACVSHAVKDKSVLADVSWSILFFSAGRRTFPPNLLPPVTADGCVYVNKPQTAARRRLPGRAAFTPAPPFIIVRGLSGRVDCVETFWFPFPNYVLGAAQFVNNWCLVCYHLGRVCVCVCVIFSDAHFACASWVSNGIWYVLVWFQTSACTQAAPQPGLCLEYHVRHIFSSQVFADYEELSNAFRLSAIWWCGRLHFVDLNFTS